MESGKKSPLIANQKDKNTLNLTAKSSSNLLTHGPIIQNLTVLVSRQKRPSSGVEFDKNPGPWFLFVAQLALL